jgi:uncharacterized protein YgbK (DUF1537 family)
MRELEKQPISVLSSFPAPDSAAAETMLKKAQAGFQKKIVVLDDDPTGTQTVHDVSVFTDWEESTLLEGFREDAPMFFLLTNSRSFSAEKTARVHAEIAERICKAAHATGKDFFVVSRGDSTLRGHYPLETEVLREGISRSAGFQFAGEILCPFFPEGGRYTFGNVHYVKEGNELVPAGMTEFAKDQTFGYISSDLTDYVQEKTGGAYSAEQCICISLEELRRGDVEVVLRKLNSAHDFSKIIVNAAEYADLKVFCTALARAEAAGKHFLARTAAPFPKVLADISDRPLLSGKELENAEDQNGALVLVGSHVKKTTDQIKTLEASDRPLRFVEFRVATYFEQGGLEAEVSRVVQQTEALIAKGTTAVVYTSRKLLIPEGKDREELLRASVEISDALTGVVARLSRKPKFLIAKGGITSSDVATKALGIRKARVMGQVRPGIPVWMTGPESKFPGMPYIVFPGNVGEVTTLREIIEELL